MYAYVLVHDNQVINGPRKWNYRSFEATLEEELEITFKLPISKQDDEVIAIDDNTYITTAELLYPQHDPRKEYCHGPFWDFTSGKAIGTFQVLPTPIDYIKSVMKEKLAANRWTREVNGTKHTVQGAEVSLDTSRDGRNIFVQKYALMQDTDTVNWKFPEGWLTLTKAELGEIVAVGATHIQAAFDWEAQTAQQIDACNHVDELLAIDIGDPTPPQMIATG